MNWSDISVSEMTIAFSGFSQSPQIQFKAVTFELPVEFETMQAWTQEDESVYYHTTTPCEVVYTDFLTGIMGNEKCVHSAIAHGII